MFTNNPREGLKGLPGRLWSRALGVLVIGLCTTCVHAGSVRLLVSGEQAYYRETQQSFVNTLKTLAPDAEVTISLLDPGAEHSPSLAGTEDIIVTIGTPAAKLVNQSPDREKTIALFITSDVYQGLIADHRSSGFRAAVALDQSPDRIMLLARLLLPESRKVATVAGPISSARIAALQESAAYLNFTLAAKTLGEKDNPVATLSPLIGNSDIFVALPDSAVFNRAIAKWVLYLSFRSKIPVIGFSKAYTDAGALASIYTSPDNIGRQGAELVAQALNRPKTFKPGFQYPHYYTLHSNPSVARALKISLPNHTELYKKYADALAKHQ